MYKLLDAIDIKKRTSKIPNKDKIKLKESIVNLRNEPRPRWSKKLKNHDTYSIAVGHYRIIYEIDETKKEITIVDVDDRKDVYRKF